MQNRLTRAGLVPYWAAMAAVLAAALFVVLLILLPGCGSQPTQQAVSTVAEGGQQTTTAADAGAGPAAPSVTFHGAAGDSVMSVEVARTQAEKSRGLMGRTSMAPDAGMIFVWSAPTDTGFWMKDTPLPLSIAFINGDGVIVDIQDMAPGTTNPHYSAASYQYAVEANRGYFARHGIRPGDSVSLSGI